MNTLSHQFPKIVILLVAVLGFLVLTAPVAAQDEPLTILVKRLDPAPDGSGGTDSRFDTFHINSPVLNDRGQAAFEAGLLSEETGIFRTDRDGTVQIAREGDPAPNSSGAFEGFFRPFGTAPMINDAGYVAFKEELEDADGNPLSEGVWIGNGSSLRQILRRGDSVPDGNGTVYRFNGETMNDRGALALKVQLEGTSGGTDDHTMILRGDGVELVQIARQGQAAPGLGEPTFTGFSLGPPLLNDAGQVLFWAILDDDLPGRGGLFIGDGTTLSQIVHEFDDAPGGGKFDSLNGLTNLNEHGQVAWYSLLDDTENWKGVFRGGAGNIVEIARLNQAAPDGMGAPDGTFSSFSSTRNFINDDGQVTFSGWVAGSSLGANDVNGIFRGNGSDMIAIVRAGEPVPDGNGTFWLINDFALNEQGQVVFDASLTDTSGGTSDDRGLFLFDDAAGIVTVAREGEPLGSLVHWRAAAALPAFPEERNGFNEFGEVAYHYTATDGSAGIALFDGELGTDPVGPDLSIQFTPETPLTAGEGGLLSATADDSELGDTDIAAIEYRLDGGDWISMAADDGAYDSPTEPATVELGFPSAGTFEVCARASDALGNPSLVWCVDIEVTPPLATVRLRAIEVNQAIQNWRNTIPLYQGKDTVVRVFLESIDSASPDAATGLLHGSVGGVALTGSPLAPESDWLTLVENLTLVDNPETDDNEAVRGRLDGSLNFILPRHWTTSTDAAVDLRFELTDPGQQVLGCEEPDGDPDCAARVVFANAPRPMFEFYAIPYARNELRELNVDATDGNFLLTSGGNDSDPLPFNATAEEVEAAIEDVLGARDGRVLVACGGCDSATGPRRFDITILRGQRETMGVDSAGLVGTATMSTTQTGGPTIGPTHEDLREQARRIADQFPTSSVDHSLRDLAGFNRAPTLLKVNTRLEKTRAIQRVLGSLGEPIKRFGYLLQRQPGSSKPAMAWLKVSSTYARESEAPESGGYHRNVGAHEAAHTYGRAHAVVRDQGVLGSVGICDSKYLDALSPLHPFVEVTAWENTKAIETAWDFAWPTIGPLSDGPDDEVWGFSPRAYANGAGFEHLAIVDPRRSTALMSYCNAPGAGQDKWVSSFSYDKLAGRIGVEAAAVELRQTSENGEIVLVAGGIDEDTGEMAIEPLTRFVGTDPGYEPGDVHVALVADDGTELVARDVALLLDGNHGSLAFGAGAETPAFFASLPVPDGTIPAGVEVWRDGTLVASKAASPSPPTVSLVSPTSGSLASNSIPVEWSAEDADGDPLVATLLYSTDGGTTWEVLAVDYEGSSYEVPTRFLAGSAQAVIRVQVSDGFHTAEAVSETFVVDAGNPLASIAIPVRSHHLACTPVLQLRGDAWDPEDGMLTDDALEWGSDLDGTLGSGGALSLDTASMTPGWHQITLTAVDSAERSNADAVHVLVGPAACEPVIFLDGFEAAGSSTSATN